MERERFEIKTNSNARMAVGFIVLFIVMIFLFYKYWYDLMYISDSFQLGLDTFMIIIFCSFLFLYAVMGIVITQLCKKKYSIELTDSDLLIYNGNILKKSIRLDEIRMLRHCGGADKISDSILISGNNANDKILSLNNISKQSDNVRPLVKKILTTGKYNKEQKIYKNMMWDEYTQNTINQL